MGLLGCAVFDWYRIGYSADTGKIKSVEHVGTTISCPTTRGGQSRGDIIAAGLETLEKKRATVEDDTDEALQRILRADCKKFIEETFFRAQTGFSSFSRPGAAQRLADSLRAAKTKDQTQSAPHGIRVFAVTQGNTITLFAGFNFSDTDRAAVLIHEAFHLASVPDLGGPFNDIRLARAVDKPVEGTTPADVFQASGNFHTALEAACGPNKP